MNGNQLVHNRIVTSARDCNSHALGQSVPLLLGLMYQNLDCIIETWIILCQDLNKLYAKIPEHPLVIEPWGKSVNALGPWGKNEPIAVLSVLSFTVQELICASTLGVRASRKLCDTTLKQEFKDVCVYVCFQPFNFSENWGQALNYNDA